jgi:hypothetical protein
MLHATRQKLYGDKPIRYGLNLMSRGCQKCQLDILNQRKRVKIKAAFD